MVVRQGNQVAYREAESRGSQAVACRAGATYQAYRQEACWAETQGSLAEGKEADRLRLRGVVVEGCRALGAGVERLIV